MNHEAYTLTHMVANIPLEEYVRDYRDKERFMGYCTQCGQYGKRWSCPPYNFDVDEYIAGYQQVLIIGTKITFEASYRHSFTTAKERNEASNEAMKTAIRMMDECHRKLEEENPGSLSFTGAKCFLCEPEPCARLMNEPCRHPEQMRHSLESVGFDISKTASQLLGMELKWATGVELPEYLILVTALFVKGESPKIPSSLFGLDTLHAQ